MNEFNVTPNPSDQFQPILNEYTRLTGRSAPLGLYESSLFSFVRAGFTVADMTLVLNFILRENSKNHFKYGLKLGTMINDLQRFNDLLEEAKARRRNHIPPPTNREKVLQEFSPVVVEGGQSPAVKMPNELVAQGLKDLARRIAK